MSPSDSKSIHTNIAPIAHKAVNASFFPCPSFTSSLFTQSAPKQNLPHSKYNNTTSWVRPCYPPMKPSKKLFGLLPHSSHHLLSFLPFQIQSPTPFYLLHSQSDSDDDRQIISPPVGIDYEIYERTNTSIGDDNKTNCLLLLTCCCPPFLTFCSSSYFGFLTLFPSVLNLWFTFISCFPLGKLMTSPSS